jgi:hypothetical protein
MRTLAGIISAFVAIISATVVPTANAAVSLSAGHSLLFDYDLSASPATGPFTSATSGIFVAQPDLLDPGDKFTLTLFDSADALLLSNTFENLGPFPLGGSQTANFFLSPTSDKVGHAILTVDEGSILVSTFLVIYTGDAGFTDFAFVPAEQAIPVTVAEPATLATLGFGLVGIIGLARLRRCQDAKAVARSP